MLLVEKEPFVYNFKSYRLSINRVVESKEYGYICAITDSSELITAATYINSKISKYPRIVKDIINCDSENPLYGEIPEDVKWVVLNMRHQFASFKIKSDLKKVIFYNFTKLLKMYIIFAETFIPNDPLWKIYVPFTRARRIYKNGIIILDLIETVFNCVFENIGLDISIVITKNLREKQLIDSTEMISICNSELIKKLAREMN